MLANICYKHIFAARWRDMLVIISEKKIRDGNGREDRSHRTLPNKKCEEIIYGQLVLEKHIVKLTESNQYKDRETKKKRSERRKMRQTRGIKEKSQMFLDSKEYI